MHNRGIQLPTAETKKKDVSIATRAIIKRFDEGGDQSEYFKHQKQEQLTYNVML